MINIVFNIDENYIEHCKYVIKSILRNTKADVCFHIIGVSVFEIQANCKFYPKPNIEGFNFTQIGNLTEASMYRLYTPLILNNINKVIYLDCDILVLSDIEELFNYEVDYIAGCLDPLFKYHATRNHLTHGYINSGVLVLNLENLRKLDYINKLKEAQKGHNISLFDQDLINIAFTDVIQHLPAKWNVYAKIYAQTTKEMMDARENPSIIHWCGADKPYNNKYVWQYDKYMCYN